MGYCYQTGLQKLTVNDENPFVNCVERLMMIKAITARQLRRVQRNRCEAAAMKHDLFKRTNVTSQSC